MTNERAERRLTAILAADIAGYSRLMGADEEGTLAQLKACRRQVVDPKIAEYRGRIVKTTGDGMLVEFASPVEVVRCAVEIQRGMVSCNADVAEDKRITFRAGINLGDVIAEKGNLFGDGVSVAARLENLCEPGGSRSRARCASRLWTSCQYALKASAVGKLDLEMASSAPKEWSRPNRLDIAAGLALAAVAALWFGYGRLNVLRPTIAVLPFDNLTGDATQDSIYARKGDAIMTTSNNSFEALGPAEFGFFTHATRITYGVNVQGVDAVTSKFGAGVYAESMLESPGSRKSQANSRAGAWAAGDHYGIYGASDLFYGTLQAPTDTTPTLSPDQLSGATPHSPGAKGGVGVVGASLNVPGVIGTSDVKGGIVGLPGSNDPGLLVDGIVPHTAGVMGLSNPSFGVMGINVMVTAPPPPPPPQILALLSLASTLPPNGGVFGWSVTGRGGVFGSAESLVFDKPIPRPPLDRGTAQVRLLPNLVSVADVGPQQPQPGPIPKLPRVGQPGDLIAVTVENPSTGQLSHAQLWFCIEAGSVAGANALWGQVQFLNVIGGDR